MPVNKITSGWSSGSLIFKRKVAATEAQVVLGEDDAGIDLKAFGETTGKYMLWDQSADKLIVVGTTDAGTSLEADAYTCGGTAGVDFASGAAPTSMQIIKGLVVYAV